MCQFTWFTLVAKTRDYDKTMNNEEVSRARTRHITQHRAAQRCIIEISEYNHQTQFHIEYLDLI